MDTEVPSLPRTANRELTASMGTHENLDDDFAAWIQDLLDKHHILGASIAVVDNGNVESAGYGLARLPNIPSTPDTIYRMASTSKAMGAAIMGLILEDDTKNTITVNGKKEKLTWSTPIIKILGEDFDFHDDYFNKNVTIEDALSNRSGVSGHDLNFGPWMGKDTRTFVRSLRHIDAVTAPMRTTFQYTNTMFAVIGHIIEKIEGKTFDEVARDRLWKPLGMTSTFATIDSLTSLDRGKNGHLLARGYYWAADNDTTEDENPEGQHSETEPGHYIAEAHLDFDLIGPAAAVLSTSNDYSKWIAALLKASNPPPKDSRDQDPIITISPTLFTSLTTPRTLVLPSAIPSIGNNLLKYPYITPQLYSLGWFTDPWMYAGQTILHHPGGCQGFGSHVFLLPEHRFGVVVMENGGGGDSKIAQTVGREVIGRRLGVGKGERRDGTMTMGRAAGVGGDGKGADTAEPSGNQMSEPSTSALPDTVDVTIVPGTYEHKAYGKIRISLAPSAFLQTKDPTIEGVRLIRKTSGLPHTKVTDTTNSPYHVSFLGRRSFLASLLLHSSPRYPSNHSYPHFCSHVPTSTSTSTSTFFTLENLWPHGDLQSDPVPDLPNGHGTANDPNHPFKQEGVCESQSLMGFGACVEVYGDGSDVRVGLVLGRTESSEFRGRVGRDKEMLVDGWRGKMVWFERIRDVI